MRDKTLRCIAAGVFLASVLAVPRVEAQQASPDRELPAPIVAVIDFKRVVETSLAGRSVIRQTNERHARIQKEIAKDTAELEAAKQQLERQRAILAPDVFQKNWREFQARVQQYRKSVQIEQRKLDLMLGQNMLRVEAKLVEVLRDIAQELGANIVIDAGPGRGNVLFSDAQLVVTSLAIERLNRALPDIKVEEPVIGAKSAETTPRLRVPKVQ